MLLLALTMRASLLAWKVEERLAGQGYFWFRGDFDEFCLFPWNQKCHLGRKDVAHKGARPFSSWMKSRILNDQTAPPALKRALV